MPQPLDYLTMGPKLCWLFSLRKKSRIDKLIFKGNYSQEIYKLSKSSQAKEEKGTPKPKGRDLHPLHAGLKHHLVLFFTGLSTGMTSVDPISIPITQSQSRHPQRTENCNSCILLMNAIQHLLTLFSSHRRDHTPLLIWNLDITNIVPPTTRIIKLL